MIDPQSICAVCAWRATCQKKFTLSGRDVSCADFTRDVTIKPEGADTKDTEKSEGTQKK